MIALFLRFVDRCSTWSAGLAAACLLAMTGLMLAEVVARNVFIQSLTFSWEFSGYLMGATFFFGAAHTLRTGGHVRVSLLAESIPPAAARALDMAVTLLGIAVTLFILYALADLTLTSFKRGILSFTPTQTPLIYPQGVLALGGLILFLQMIARLIRLFRHEPPDIETETVALGTKE